MGRAVGYGVDLSMRNIKSLPQTKIPVPIDATLDINDDTNNEFMRRPTFILIVP